LKIAAFTNVPVTTVEGRIHRARRQLRRLLRDDLSDYQRTTLLALFCETFGLLLVSGVPITQAMRTLAELLPAAIKGKKMLATLEALTEREWLPVGRSMEQLGILPRFALEMIAIGEEGGHLDGALERTAEVFRHDLECRILAET
jgi:MSHA biogenesis protein MshG